VIAARTHKTVKRIVAAHDAEVAVPARRNPRHNYEVAGLVRERMRLSED
jgi:hypothetical protein